ncbi:claudin-7-like [Panthera pardus]|uniref:Claudin n=1 Tax=Panthera pardus TaxID=9691 RepID=A0A9W2V0C5_PANPR|nr:claudin-7-like [Panthera pardus]
MALLGWVGLVARTAIPQWHVSSQEGDNSITGQARYKGLWMDCVTQGTGVLSCKIGHTGHLVAASRGLGFLATLDTMGTRCASCSGEDQVKRARVAVTGGIIFIVKGPAASNRTACSGVATRLGAGETTSLNKDLRTRWTDSLTARELRIRKASVSLQEQLWALSRGERVPSRQREKPLASGLCFGASPDKAFELGSQADGRLSFRGGTAETL